MARALLRVHAGDCPRQSCESITIKKILRDADDFMARDDAFVFGESQTPPHSGVSIDRTVRETNRSPTFGRTLIADGGI